MRGLECHIEQLDAHLFSGFSMEEFDWYIYEDEIIVGGEQKPIRGKISANELMEILSNPGGLIIFANIQAFPKGEKAKQVLDYSDFLQSRCSFVILVTDLRCLEIYVKEDIHNVRFAENIRRCNGTDIVNKTDENDGRTVFSFV